MTIEQEIREAVAWLEIDRLTERALAMKPRSFKRMELEVKVALLMNAKIVRENQSLKFNGPEAA